MTLEDFVKNTMHVIRWASGGAARRALTHRPTTWSARRHIASLPRQKFDVFTLRRVFPLAFPGWSEFGCGGLASSAGPMRLAARSLGLSAPWDSCGPRSAGLFPAPPVVRPRGIGGGCGTSTARASPPSYRSWGRIKPDSVRKVASPGAERDPSWNGLRLGTSAAPHLATDSRTERGVVPSKCAEGDRLTSSSEWQPRLLASEESTNDPGFDALRCGLWQCRMFARW